MEEGAASQTEIVAAIARFKAEIQEKMLPALATAEARTRLVAAAVEQLDKAAAVLHEFEAQRCLGRTSAESLAAASLRVGPAAAAGALEAAVRDGIVEAAGASTTIASEVDENGTLALGHIDASEEEPLLTVAVGGGLLAEMTPAEARPVVAARQDAARSRLRTARESERRIRSDVASAEKALGRLIRLSSEQDDDQAA